MMRSLPKGAALHVHSDSMVSLKWLVANATYDPHLWLCGDAGALGKVGAGKDYRFVFSKGSPASRPVNPTRCNPSHGSRSGGAGGGTVNPSATSGWQRVVDLRLASGDAFRFDEDLVELMTIVTPPTPDPTKRPCVTLFHAPSCLNFEFGKPPLALRLAFDLAERRVRRLKWQNWMCHRPQV
jgi:hypothetical protein